MSSGLGEGLMSSHSLLGASCSFSSPRWGIDWGQRFVISHGYYLGDQVDRGDCQGSLLLLSLQRGVASHDLTVLV